MVCWDKAHDIFSLSMIIVTSWLIACHAPCAPIAAASSDQFSHKVKQLRWVAYTPTQYDPTRTPPIPATIDGIRQDLKSLRPYFNGVITYGAKLGLDQIPQLAREEGFEGVIVGVWNPKDNTEMTAAENVAKRGVVDAICVGNEGLQTSRYDWQTLSSAMQRLQKLTGLPVGTTEEILQYGDMRLLKAGDFLLPNIHPWWNGFPPTDVAKAADWVERQVSSLSTESGNRLILVKESGFPSAGAIGLNEEVQADFWKLLYGRAAMSGHRYAFFEGFDMAWKHEQSGANDVGPHWGAFSADRVPKTVVTILRERARTTP